MSETKQRYTRLLLVSSLGSLITLTLASCASTMPPADTNRDGVLSDNEMEQHRRQQEVRGVQPGATAKTKTIKGVRTAREIAGTANTFRWFSTWF